MKDLGHFLETADRPYYFIGRADVAKELDAKRAIDQGMRLFVALILLNLIISNLLN